MSLFYLVTLFTQYGGKWDLISTFLKTPTQAGKKCSGPAQYANCMTAACYIKTAFDGSPITCYCPVYSAGANDTYVVLDKLGKSRSCNDPPGYVLSAA